MKIRITKHIYLNDIKGELYDSLIETFTIQNPKWIENVRMGRWNKGTPRYIKLYKKASGGLIIPRGYARQLILLCRRMKISYDIEDRRRMLPEINFQFKGQLKPFQEIAVKKMTAKDFGTLSAPTGSGKTVMALHILVKRKQSVLIVVHTKSLAFQWIERINEFLGVPEDEIGLIGAGKKKVGKKITVSLVQSLYKCADDVSKTIGFLIVDECHRTPSRTFTEAVSKFDSKYMLGLSATPWRRDKLSKLIFLYLGDVHHEVDQANLIKTGDVLSVDVVIRKTGFQPYFDPTTDYSRMLTELVTDDERNRLIAGDVAKEAFDTTGVCLVLSDRKKHCETLRAILRYRFKVSSEILTGDVPIEERKEIIKRLNNGEVKILVGTGQLVGEGFDCRNLSTLFLATPIKFSGRVVQYLGRVLRPAPGKDRARVFDYVDVNVGPLAAAARARLKVYHDSNVAEK